MAFNQPGEGPVKSSFEALTKGSKVIFLHTFTSLGGVLVCIKHDTVQLSINQCHVSQPEKFGGDPLL